jgi:diguanylate cyclase (GGDEF)-like protein
MAPLPRDGPLDRFGKRGNGDILDERETHGAFVGKERSGHHGGMRPDVHTGHYFGENPTSFAARFGLDRLASRAPARSSMGVGMAVRERIFQQNGDPRPVRVLHESRRTRVTRVAFGEGTLIRKEPLGPGADERLRHEFAMLERLAGVDGVVQLAPEQRYRGALLLEDSRAGPLAAVRTPMDVAALTAFAMDLARVLGAVHDRGIMHGDVNPGNILLTERKHRPVLIDFALATTLAQPRSQSAHGEIVGTLPYLAPEQTGRTGWPVDLRADLYALGATLYQLATGVPPFGTGEPVGLIHDVLTRVPRPPAAVNPAIPADLSSIIMRLLAKEPDNRYQTADGVRHDLAQVRTGHPLVRMGERDYPAGMLAPSRLAGRDEQIAQLGTAFAEAASGGGRGVLIGGAPGVGKSSLIDQLRPMVKASGGWLVSGKFDQYRRDQEFDGAYQAFRALGRLLLAEPDDELAEVKGRLLRGLGPYAGLVTAVIPEFAALLRVAPDMGDPLTAQARAQRNATEILRAVATRKRPVVFVVDDLQWAGRTPLGFLDQVFSGGEDIEGLLLVCAYRDSEVDATHPLASMINRWELQQGGPLRISLDNLSVEDAAAVVADMLRVSDEASRDLAAALVERTMGNPYDMVELINTWRHEGLLQRGPQGWHWDSVAVREQAHADPADVLAERANAMPKPTRMLLYAMACLAGRVDLRLLRIATGLSSAEIERRLAPALEDGLVLFETGAADALRFRHDRVQESVLRRLGSRRTADLRLRLARRLAKRPDCFAVAAELYLPVADAVHDPDERAEVAALLGRAAEQAALLSNFPLVERLLVAAVDFTDPTDTATLVQLHTSRHVALYSLGRLNEADDVYRTIERLSASPLERTEATLVQVSSLTNQGRSPEALALGVDLLRQLGVTVPLPDRIDDEVQQRLDALYRWLGRTTIADDLAHAQTPDPANRAVGALINRLMPPAFFSDQPMMNWLSLEALRMWAEQGPGPTLVGPASHIAFVMTPLRGDYRNAYRLMRRILAVGEACGYEPQTSQARFLYGLGSDQWFEPIEDNLVQALRAREVLVHGGDLQNACWTYYPVVYELFDCAPSLDNYLVEVESALQFARSTGNNHAAEMFGAYRRLASLMLGEPMDTPAETAVWPGASAGNPLAWAVAHLTRALGAAILDMPADTARHLATAMPLLRFIGPAYPTAVAHLLLALNRAEQARVVEAGERERPLSEMDTAIDWLAARAADAPMNFQHLLHLVEAERAWTIGDFRAAAAAFDSALRAVATRQRPWHRALILERTARFYLAHGIDTVGSQLLGQAREAYSAWGATAKVDQIDWAYPAIHGATGGAAPVAWDVSTNRSSIPAGTIDLLGIHAASQALSSETTTGGLRIRVAEVLSAMTGATAVHLLLWDDEHETWLAPSPDSDATRAVDASDGGRLAPLSVLRYVERTREPLVVSDATEDDRFARDSYLAGADRCSLLAVPIVNRGNLLAVLLLENRFIRGAFSADRLDGVMLIAGQLAVSLDNALVYTSLEQKVAERTEQLTIANQRLEQLSTTDPLTGVANRRRLQQVLNNEWRRAERSGRSLAVAMIDIDRFKLYNDRHGHAAGDRCLQRVAANLLERVRDADLVARYGGEEFAVVMPGADLDTALLIAHRLRARIAEVAEPGVPKHEQAVTASIGVCVASPVAGGTWEQLVKGADEELYRAKRAGRDQVQPSATHGASPQ